MPTPVDLLTYWIPDRKVGARMVAAAPIVRTAGGFSTPQHPKPAPLEAHSAALLHGAHTFRHLCAYDFGPFVQAATCPVCTQSGAPVFLHRAFVLHINAKKGVSLTFHKAKPTCSGCGCAPDISPQPAHSAHALLSLHAHTQQALRAYFGADCTTIDGAFTS